MAEGEGEMILGVDVSKWQAAVDWKLLRSVGVEFAIVKSSQGNYHKDPMLEAHANGAAEAGMLVGLYHWCDPIVASDTAQSDFFLNLARKVPHHFACADVEQFWMDWAEWPNRVTKYLTAERIEGNAHNILERWRTAGERPVLYTRKSFIEGFAPKIASWAGNYATWWAHYPYNETRVSTSWEYFLANFLPTIKGPALPKGVKSWSFWQFTGDKFALPGMWGDVKRTKPSAADVNFFNGTLEELRAFCGLATPALPPAPAEPTDAEKLARLWAAHPELH